MILKILLVILFIVLLAWGLLLTFRNNKTCAFMNFYSDAAFEVVGDFLNSLKDDQELNDRIEEYKELKKMCLQIVDKYSFEQILYSLKPFKLEAWFTPEEVEFIKRGL
jgi:cell shape-determining protein MreC